MFIKKLRSYPRRIPTEEEYERAKDSMIRGFVEGQKKKGIPEETALAKVMKFYGKT